MLCTVCSAAVDNVHHVETAVTLRRSLVRATFRGACVLHSINKRLNQQWYAYTATLLHAWELTYRPSPMAYEAAEGLRLFPVVDELLCNSSFCLCVMPVTFCSLAPG